MSEHGYATLPDLRCPACGGTVFVGDGGYLTCSWIACPEPDAPHKAAKACVRYSAIPRSKYATTMVKR